MPDGPAVTLRLSPASAILPLLAILLAPMTGRPAAAQIAGPITIRDVNPSRSDNTDPDGASGGRVNGLGRASNGSAFYAASEWGGLYRSLDSGQTWAHLDGHVPTVTWDVEVSRVDAQRVYATSFYDGRVNSIAGINVSTDGGVTWTHPASATPPAGFCTTAARRDNPAAFGISIDPDSVEHVYIGTNCGLAISRDAGATWTFVDPTPAASSADAVWDVLAQKGGIIDLCGDDGHMRSTNFGLTWTTAAVNRLPSGRCSIDVSPDESYVLFAVVGTTIYQSLDGGGSWTASAQTNPSAQGRIPFVKVNDRAGTAFDLWFGDIRLWRAGCATPATPASGGTARCTGAWAGPFTRSVGGHDDMGDLAFDPGAASDACPVLMSSDGGVYRNTLATSPACHTPVWTQPTVTPHATWLFAMGGGKELGVAEEALYFGLQDNGAWATQTAGATPPTWTNPFCCDAFDMAATATQVAFTVCCFSPAPANRLFVANAGMAAPVGPTPSPPGTLRGWVYPDVIVPYAVNGYAVISSNLVYYTSNITATAVAWTQLGAATSPPFPAAIQVAIDNGTPTFYVQTGSASGQGPDQLWRFVDTLAGAWQQVAPPGNVGGFGVVGVDPRNPNRLLVSHIRAGLDPAMMLTTDGGTTWTALTALDNLMTGSGAFRYRNVRGATDFTGFTGYPQPTLAAFDPEDTGNLVAGAADAGLFVSIDGGTTWQVVTDPIAPGTSSVPHLPRPRYAYFDHDGSTLVTRVTNVYVGTQGRGVWRVSFTKWNNIVTVCVANPRICRPPRLGRELIELRCLITECVVIDRIDKNCLVKWSCPGCPPGSLCTGWQNIWLDGLDLARWDVGIFTRRGEPFPHDVIRTGRGVVVSFQPDKERRIGDYILGFAMKPGAPLGTTRIKTRLEVSNEPFRSRAKPGGSDGGAPLR